MPQDSKSKMRRHIRPVERQPMKAWLVEHLDSGALDGLVWVDKQNGIFKVKWCHGSRQGWNKKDMAVFEQWAKHTGRHYHGKERDEKRWKANFRCALNSLKDVVPVNKSLKGQNAFREYKIKDFKPQIFYDAVIPSRRSSRGLRTKIGRKSEDETDEEGIQNVEVLMSEQTEESPYMIKEPILKPIKLTLPNFEKISPGLGANFEYGKQISIKNHNCGYVVTLIDSSAPDQSTISAFTGHDQNINYNFPDTPEGSDSSPENAYVDQTESMEMVANSITVSTWNGDSDGESQNSDGLSSSNNYPLTPSSDSSPEQDQSLYEIIFEVEENEIRMDRHISSGMGNSGTLA